MDCSTPGLPVHHQLLELAQTHVHRVGDAMQPSHPLVLFSSCLQSFPASRSFPISQFFATRGPKYWSFTFSISPFNEYSGLISFRMDSLDLLTVRGLLKSLLQHHSSKASVLQHSAFFIVQLSHPYMTTGKTTALTRWTFHYGMKSIACPISKTKDVTAIEPSHCSPFAGEPRGNSGWRQRMPTIWQSTATATPKGAP